MLGLNISDHLEVSAAPFSGITVEETKAWRNSTAHVEFMETQLITFLDSRSKFLLPFPHTLCFSPLITHHSWVTAEATVIFQECYFKTTCFYSRSFFQSDGDGGWIWFLLSRWQREFRPHLNSKKLRNQTCWFLGCGSDTSGCQVEAHTVGGRVRKRP